MRTFPERLAAWLSHHEAIRSWHVRELGLDETPDTEVFALARLLDATIVSKDGDYPQLVAERGAPPQVVWVRTGNAATQRLLELFETEFQRLLDLLDAETPVVAIGG